MRGTAWRIVIRENGCKIWASLYVVGWSMVLIFSRGSMFLNQFGFVRDCLLRLTLQMVRNAFAFKLYELTIMISEGPSMASCLVYASNMSQIPMRNPITHLCFTMKYYNWTYNWMNQKDALIGTLLPLQVLFGQACTHDCLTSSSDHILRTTMGRQFSLRVHRYMLEE